MVLKTFTIEKVAGSKNTRGKVWFNLEIENGRVTYLEEHDHYAGGPIGQGDMTEEFLNRVKLRRGNPLEAQAFIMENS